MAMGCESTEAYTHREREARLSRATLAARQWHGRARHSVSQAAKKRTRMTSGCVQKASPQGWHP